jgi:hypothetical protein
VTVEECLILCDATPGCLSVSYRWINNDCVLQNTNKKELIKKFDYCAKFDLYLKNTSCSADSSPDHLTAVRKSILYKELETRFEVENDFGEK